MKNIHIEATDYVPISYSEEFNKISNIYYKHRTFDMLLAAIKADPECKFFIKRSPLLTKDEKEYLCLL